MRRSRYFYAFTIFSPAPSSHVRRLLAVISISRCRASLVAHAMCGVSRAFGRPRKGLACGSGSVPTGGSSYHVGDLITVLFTPAPTRSGYNFLGWADSANGPVNEKYKAGIVFSFPKTHRDTQSLFVIPHVNELLIKSEIHLSILFIIIFSLKINSLLSKNQYTDSN